MNQKNNATYQHILNTAEQLFSERGYAGVTLQDIARSLDMRHASLYYYAPSGKEQLYIEVMVRLMRRHGEGLTRAIIEAGDDVRAQLLAVAEWFASQPPLDLGRLVRSDMPMIAPAEAERLIDLSLNTLRMPIAAVLRNGMKKGLLAVEDADFAAMGIIGLLQSVHNIPPMFLATEAARINAFKAALDMLLDGLMKR